MDELLLEITSKLDEVTILKYKDENWGQLEDFGSNCPVKWPCALVELAGGQFSNLATDYRSNEGNRQEGILTIEITIGNVKLTNTSTKAPLAQKTKGFEVWKIVKSVHEILQGWKPLTNSGAMVRTGVQSVRRDDGVQEKRITYTIGLHGC